MHRTVELMMEDLRNHELTRPYFWNKKVLDVGSLNINGSNRAMFVDCEFTGVDVVPGKDVDIVSTFHEVKLPKESFDVVISTNALEHDIYWDKTLLKMIELLKPGGLMIISVAHDWNEHGTKNKQPGCSGTSQMSNPWCNYYRNLDKLNITSVLRLDKLFSSYDIRYAETDTQVWGIKRLKDDL